MELQPPPVTSTPYRSVMEQFEEMTDKKNLTYDQGGILNKQSGYDLLWLSEQYLDIASVINKKIIEGDKESAKVLLSESSKIVEQISDLNVSPKYEDAKEYLRSATWLDGFSYVMMLEGMPRKDYEETMNDGGLRQMYLFVQEMNKLGHDIKF